jgi:hypothetical protein
VYPQVVPVFNFRRVDLLMRQWDVKQGRLEAALFKHRQTGQRPLANARGCLGGPKVTAQQFFQLSGWKAVLLICQSVVQWSIHVPNSKKSCRRPGSRMLH